MLVIVFIKQFHISGITCIVPFQYYIDNPNNSNRGTLIRTRNIVVDGAGGIPCLAKDSRDTKTCEPCVKGISILLLNIDLQDLYEIPFYNIHTFIEYALI